MCGCSLIAVIDMTNVPNRSCSAIDAGVAVIEVPVAHGPAIENEVALGNDGHARRQLVLEDVAGARRHRKPYFRSARDIRAKPRVPATPRREWLPFGAHFHLQPQARARQFDALPGLTKPRPGVVEARGQLHDSPCPRNDLPRNIRQAAMYRVRRRINRDGPFLAIE